MKNIEEVYISNILLPRDRDAHKGNFGRLLIMAGSPGMAGAAVLSARGGLRSGAGTVTVSADPEIFPILQSAVPEAMCSDRRKKTNAARYSALVIGPGLGDHRDDAEKMGNILKKYTGTVIIDADGLNNIWRYDLERQMAETGSEVIITPHPGEAARLLGRKEILDRREAVTALSAKYRCVAVLKGHGTLIATGDGEIWKNPTGNPGMATGGSGDVLSGVIGALAAQGYDPVAAAQIGVFVHGLAGDLCAERWGEIGMTAGDLIDFLPRAFQQMMKKNGENHGNQ